MCRRSAPRGIGQEKVSGILVGNKSMKKEKRKSPVLAAVGSMTDIFPYPPFQDLGDADIEWLTFPTLTAVWCGGGAPWLVWLEASRQNPRFPPHGSPAPAQSPGHHRCLVSQQQSQVGVKAGGAAVAVLCAGDQRHGGSVRKR